MITSKSCHYCFNSFFAVSIRINVSKFSKILVSDERVDLDELLICELRRHSVSIFVHQHYWFLCVELGFQQIEMDVLIFFTCYMHRIHRNSVISNLILLSFVGNSHVGKEGTSKWKQEPWHHKVFLGFLVFILCNCVKVPPNDRTLREPKHSIEWSLLSKAVGNRLYWLLSSKVERLFLRELVLHTVVTIQIQVLVKRCLKSLFNQNCLRRILGRMRTLK